ncbi:MAG: prepilin-type N-terminal cleavage/methylation domain-containing protein [Nitrospirae bacterium YQR-1]
MMANVQLNKGGGNHLQRPATPVNGFTLVEAMMAMLILTVILLGLLQAMIFAADATMKNSLRDTAVNVAKEELETQRTLAKSSGVSAVVTNSNYTVQRTIKNYTFTYTINRTVTTQVDSRLVNMTVSWTYKGETFTYNPQTLISP